MNIIKLYKGDITKVDVDVIVNAANTSLLGGGGVDGAIHKAGGTDILDECRDIRNRQGGCKTGEAVITTAGKLPALKVIHTVGPVWNKGDESEKDLLRSCYRNSIKIAIHHGYKSIAFPNISTGIYHFPKDEAAKLAIDEVLKNQNDDYDLEVIFVCFDDENYRIYEDLINKK